jgi:hypothetical protein
MVVTSSLKRRVQARDAALVMNFARNFRESTGWPDAGEKSLSNIGRIGARQIAENSVFTVVERQILPGGQKKKPAAAYCRTPP